MNFIIIKYKSHRYLLFFFLGILSLFFANNSFGQITKISGSVVDSLTKEPIPFANIYLKGTNVGATSDFNGQFSLNTKVKSDTLVLSCVGYAPVKIKISVGIYQELRVKMLSNNIELEEVVIRPGENPAHRILRNVIENKEKNHQEEITSYQYEVYNKIQFDANNVSEQFQNRRIMKPFSFVFDYIDTSTVNGKSYLPIFLTESVSDVYFQKEPEKKKEFIKASRAAGMKNASISQFLGNMSQLIDIYENYIVLFDKNFVSPVSKNALNTYKFYLIDSANRDGHWCYQLMFKPKRKQELTFTGEIWITDTTWAVKEFKMSMDPYANINFVNAFDVQQKFVLVENKYWFLSFDNVIVDFNVIEGSKKTTGFYAHKTASYQKIIINHPKDESFYRSPVDIYVDDSSFDKNEEYWVNARHEELSEEEKTIYRIVDTITKLPIYKTWYELVSTVMYGYYSFEKFDFGPYFQTYSINEIEGHRFRLGGQTGYNWSPKYRVIGHLAYGTKDQKFKYGLSFIYLKQQNPRRAYTVSYKNDVEQLGQSINAFRQDNIVASFIRRRPFTKLTMVEEYKAIYEHEYFNGLSNKITFRHRGAFPLQGTKFEFYPNIGQTEVRNIIYTADLEYNIRFAYKEKFFIDKYSRTSLGTKYPIINLYFNVGIPKLFGSDYGYQKVNFSINHWYNIKGIGWSRYIVTAGKIWGKLPYPLLEIHGGNETYTFDEQAFNRMNYYEFISDQYVSVYYTHHFDGFFLNHIPLMRKLKWREVVYGRGLMGTLTNENKNYSKFLPFSGELGEPYFEAGIAIENIFKVIRIDACWRLSHLDHQDIVPFGFMGTFYFTF